MDGKVAEVIADGAHALVNSPLVRRHHAFMAFAKAS